MQPTKRVNRKRSQTVAPAKTPPVEVRATPEKCEKCNGQGCVPVLCPACQGDLHKSFHRCKKCRGVGFIDAKCKTCNGTGEFIEKMEEEKE